MEGVCLTALDREEWKQWTARCARHRKDYGLRSKNEYVEPETFLNISKTSRDFSCFVLVSFHVRVSEIKLKTVLFPFYFSDSFSYLFLVRLNFNNTSCAIIQPKPNHNPNKFRTSHLILFCLSSFFERI